MIKQFIYMIIMAIIFSLWEIQIEGGDGGWARHLPTFRINVFFNKLLGGKPLTGYHIYLLLFMTIVFHGLFSDELYTYHTTMKAIGLMSLFFVLEDFLWFVFNKHYTFKHFKQGHISWHNRWALGLPITYWWGMIIGTGLLILGGK